MTHFDWIALLPAIGLVAIWVEVRQLRLLLTKRAELERQVERDDIAKRIDWRYLTVIPNWNPDEMRFVFYVNGQLDEQLARRMSDRTTDLVLNELGIEGCELAAVAASPEGVAKVYYFKQPLQQHDTSNAVVMERSVT